MAKVIKNFVLVLACLALVVPAVLLFTGVLPYRIYVVHTGSMTPTIPSRSAVVVRKGVYQVGQVISFESVNGVVTHRLIRREPDGMLVTKGDANRTADPGQTSPSNVIGGVVLAPRGLGYWLVYLKNPAGAASALLTIVCVWLIFSIMGGMNEWQRARQTAKATAVSTDAASAAASPVAVQEAAAASLPVPRPVSRPVLVLDTEAPRLVWRAVPRQPLAFKCFHCEAEFDSRAELRLHGATHSEVGDADELVAHLPTYLRKPPVVWSAPVDSRTLN